MTRARRRAATALLAGCAALLVASAASAQSSRWRGGERSRLDERADASSQSFAFELRFGPYWPQVDEEFGTTAGPYGEVFDNDPQFYFGLELDWLPLRIPFVGAVGPGFGWGYTSATAKARVTGSEDLSDVDTSLSIMPMHLSAVLRADELMRRTGIPVVPYAKIGLGLGLWSASVAGETSETDGVLGRDSTWGIHFALGGMLALNWVDPRAAGRLDETMGVNHAYLFAEWMNANLDGIGSRPQMHVGSSSLVVGLAADM